MKKFNLVIVLNQDFNKVLMCKRSKEPYLGLINFVGGKIELNEDSISGAYRELYEETGIDNKDIDLIHFMDMAYYFDDCFLEIYVGKLNKDVILKQEINELLWIDCREDFFDDRFAGMGNIGHIMKHLLKCLDNL